MQGAWWFPRVIAHYPYIILTAVSLFSSICIIIPLTTRKLPDFSDPQMVNYLDIEIYL